MKAKPLPTCLPVALLAALGLVGTTQAQSLGSWNIVQIKANFKKGWSQQAEAQMRSLGFYKTFHYLEYKTWTHFQLNPGMALGLGVGRYFTHPGGGNFVEPATTIETRLWPQVLLFQPLFHFQVEQRYRTELRFTNQGYRNRFRYRVALSRSFGKLKQGNKPFLLGGSSELFFTNRAPYFERIRWHLSVHARISPNVLLQVGFLHQFDFRLNDETGPSFLQMGLYYEFNWKKNPAPQLNPTLLKEN